MPPAYSDNPDTVVSSHTFDLEEHSVENKNFEDKSCTILPLVLSDNPDTVALSHTLDLEQHPVENNNFEGKFGEENSNKSDSEVSSSRESISKDSLSDEAGHEDLEDIDASHYNNVIRQQARGRTSFTEAQLYHLEKEYEMDGYLSRTRKMVLAKNLGLPANTIKIWFQNRRMKNKRRRRKSSTSGIENPQPMIPMHFPVPQVYPYHLQAPEVLPQPQVLYHPAAFPYPLYVPHQSNYNGSYGYTSPYINYNAPYTNCNDLYTNCNDPYTNYNGPYTNYNAAYTNYNGPYTVYNNPYCNIVSAPEVQYSDDYGAGVSSHLQALETQVLNCCNSCSQTLLDPESQLRIVAVEHQEAVSESMQLNHTQLQNVSSTSQTPSVSSTQNDVDATETSTKSKFFRPFEDN